MSFKREMPSSTNDIFLLPYGGGSASSFRSYVAGFPRDVGRVVPLDIPGRGKRAHEQRARSIQECAALALQQMDTTAGSYVLHGHCMGALLAFEAIKLIEASGRRPPRMMVVSGRNAPRHVNAWLRRVASLDDRGLFEELRELGGVPRRLSFAMAREFLSSIRDDQAMFQDYDPGEAKIGVPILVLAGKDDKMTSPDALAAWADYTSKPLSIEWLEGGHYFILDQPGRVAQCVEKLRGVVDPA